MGLTKTENENFGKEFSNYVKQNYGMEKEKRNLEKLYNSII